MHIASHNGHFEIVKVLLDVAANINIQTNVSNIHVDGVYVLADSLVNYIHPVVMIINYKGLRSTFQEV